MPQTSLPAGRSYASGTYPVALLGDTIGDNFDRTASRFADREALVDVAARRRGASRPRPLACGPPGARGGEPPRPAPRAGSPTGSPWPGGPPPAAGPTASWPPTW